jgi:lipase maturation factor 1
MTGWIFRRLIGATYFVAFWSLGRQVLGLIGERGIVPAQIYMDAVHSWAAAQQIGFDRFRVFPTLCWISTSDAFLTGLCTGGLVLAALLFAGIAPLIVVPLLWLTYLSLSVAAQDFLSYQWDALLLEAGFLTIFIAPALWRDRLRDVEEVPRIARWLMLWLLFRLMFGSGAMKLASGDPTWRQLTAMSYHFETQPIPTPVAWFAHQLPGLLHQASTAAVLGIELVAPLLIVGTRRLRLVAFGLLVGLQTAIALTGNYAFFNLLSVALCVFLLDDATLQKIANRCGVRLPPSREASADRRSLGGGGQADRPKTDFRLKPKATNIGSAGARRVMLAIVAAFTLPATFVAFGAAVGMRLPGWQLTEPIARFVAPLRLANTYGLFSVMTTTRPEIVIEGSADGVEWKAYEFRYKPGNVNRRPPWVAPHQPRLDWQMWFAALGDYETDAWFRRFCERLLEGSPDVLALMERDPFEGRPPQTVRAVMYQYRFADPARRLRSGQALPARPGEAGAWWVRERVRELFSFSRTS